MINGAFAPDYNGAAKLNGKWVYVSNGQVDFKYSGILTVNGVNYTVKYGVIQL